MNIYALYVCDFLALTQVFSAPLPALSTQASHSCCFFVPVPSLITQDVLFVVVQLLSRVRLFATPWTTARQAPLSFTVSHSSLRFMPIESVMPSNHHILCHLLLLLPSVLPASGSFPVSRLFASGGQTTEASASVLLMNIQD